MSTSAVRVQRGAAKAAANVSTGTSSCPFEVYARGKFSDYAGDAYTGKTHALRCRGFLVEGPAGLRQAAGLPGEVTAIAADFPPVVSVAEVAITGSGHSSERPILCHGAVARGLRYQDGVLPKNVYNKDVIANHSSSGETKPFCDY